MRSIKVGTDRRNGRPFAIPLPALARHLHLIGATGTGKTTFLITMLVDLITACRDATVFVLDRMGGFSEALTRFFASEYCPEHARRRLIYIQTAREDRIMTLHPLGFGSPAEGDFRVDHTTELVLRGMAQTSIGAMPRLKNWTGTTFLSDLLLGLTLPDSMHFLLPGSPHRQALVGLLPEQMRHEWAEVLMARGPVESQLLESTRNRLKPFWTQAIPRAQFGSTVSRFDVRRFLAEGRFVLIDLSPRGRVSDHMADCQAGMILNEIFTVLRSLSPREVRPCYIVLDEFQRYVSGPEMTTAIPEVRQRGARLILSHQSMDQLRQGDWDLTGLIFQCQNRGVFGLGGPDADLLAGEIASLRYEPLRIKDQITHRSQRVVGHRIVELRSNSRSAGSSQQWGDSEAHGEARRSGATHPGAGGAPSTSEGTDSSQTRTRSGGGARTDNLTEGSHETLVPVHEEFLQVASRNFYTFDEQRKLWEQAIRRQRTGQAFFVLANDPDLYEVDVRRTACGHLGLDWADVERHLPRVADAHERMLHKNFSSELFVSPEEVELEARLRLQRLLPAAQLLGPPRLLLPGGEEVIAGDDQEAGDDPLL